MRKTLAIILSLTMLLGIVPFCVSAEDTYYKTITFGSYPQSLVDEEEVIAALNEAAADKVWTSYKYMESLNTPGDYMRYCDIDLDGDGVNDYRGVTFDKYRPDTTTNTTSTAGNSNFDQFANGYFIDNIYYFRYEPLVWRVLDEKSGLILCESLIDAQAFNDYCYKYNNDIAYVDSAMTTYINKWEASSIRKWLNETFYDAAFRSDEKAYISKSTITNKGRGTDRSTYADTTDNIFLLSYDDALNTSYGFSSSVSETDSAKTAQGTDYAKSQGIWINHTGTSEWTLRSAGTEYTQVCSVDAGGYPNCGNSSNKVYFGIRPAMYLDPESSVYQSIHNCGEPEYTWNGTESCTAKFTCADCEYEATVDGDITSEVTTPPTEDSEGVETFTATFSFGGKTYTSTTTAAVPPTAAEDVITIWDVIQAVINLITYFVSVVGRLINK